MKRLPILIVLGIALVLLGTPAPAYVPIEINGVEVKWAPADQPVSFVIQSAGSDDIADTSEHLAIRRAFDSWEDLSESAITFFENLADDENRTDFTSFDIHLIIFDETNFSGFFPGASGTVAVTPITFNSFTGEILDADIVFNGDDHDFSTDRSSGTFDVQSIAAHEIGHFLGLDHSPNCSATMFPFAASAVTTQRSLSVDDVAGADHLYPGGTTTGAISGTVRRGDSSPVLGAHVVAVDSDGVVQTSTLTAADGSFLIDKLPAKDYTVLAEPLDLPVRAANFSSDFGGGTPDTDFETTYLGGNPSPSTVTVTTGNTTAAGLLTVGASGPVNLRAASDYPVLARRGAFASLLVTGTGLAGSDTLNVTGTGVTFFFTSFSSGTFTVVLQVSGSAALGPRNFEITGGSGEFAVLTGLVEVVEAAPDVTDVSPNTGPAGGGTTIVLTGTGFQTGAVVRVGDQLATGVSVDSSTQITATTPAGTGSVPVLVQNPDGQLFSDPTEVFDYVQQPSITSVHPAAGSDAGGTTVLIAGDEFAPGLTVTVGGASATVTNVAETAITITTPTGTAGDVDVVVTNPGGLTDTLSNGYTYLTTTDPVITSIVPGNGPASVGTAVTITGSGFQTGALVYLGKAADGSGGVLGAFINVISAGEIQFTSPILGSGAVSVEVENPDGSTARVENGYTYDAAPVGGGGGGGGGCFAVPPIALAPGGGDPRGPLGALLPFALVFLILWFLRREGRGTAFGV